MKTAKRITRIGEIIIAIVIILSIGWYAGYSIGSAPVKVEQTVKKKQHAVTKNAHLESILEQVAVNKDSIKDIDIRYVDSFVNGEEGRYVSRVDETTDYAKHPYITIKSGMEPSEEKATVAHEYLHAVWSTFGNRDKYAEDFVPKLSKELTNLYETDPYMKQRMDWYLKNKTFNADELFAIYCTESSDEFLTVDLIITCNTYIHRDTLVFLR